MRPYRNLLLACASLLGSWAFPAYAGKAQASFPVNITLINPLYSGGAGVIKPSVTGSSSCTSRSTSGGGGAVVTIACEANEFVSFERLPGNPFLDTDRDADRFVLQPGALVSPDDPMWYPGTGTVTTMQIHYRNKPEDTMQIRVNF